MKGDILHRDNLFLVAFNQVNILQEGTNNINENAAQDLHKAQRKMSIQREKIMDKQFKLSIGRVTALAFIGLIIQNIYALTQREYSKMNYLTSYLIDTNSIIVYSISLLNVVISVGLITITCYLNIYSQDMVDMRDGIKLHKKLGKLVYLFGLFSSAIYLFQGFCQQYNFYLITVAIFQGFFLMMCIGTASMKQFLSHRVWSYCLNSLYLQIALNVYFDWLLNAFEKQEFLSYSSALSTFLSIIYLVKQEYSIDKIDSISNSTFQISLDAIPQKVKVVSEDLQENPFKTQFCSQNAIKVSISLLQKLLRGIVFVLSVIWIVLFHFVDEKIMNIYKGFLSLLMLIYFFAVLIPFSLKLKQMKKLKKLLKQKNKQK